VLEPHIKEMRRQTRPGEEKRDQKSALEFEKDIGVEKESLTKEKLTKKKTKNNQKDNEKKSSG